MTMRPVLTVANVRHLRQLLAKAVEYANNWTDEYQGIEMFKVADFDPLFELVYEVARLRAALKAEIDRNTPLEAQLRVVCDAARDFFVDVDGEAMCDAWDGHCGCSAFRLSAALTALDAPRLTENATSHKAGK